MASNAQANHGCNPEQMLQIVIDYKNYFLELRVEIEKIKILQQVQDSKFDKVLLMINENRGNVQSNSNTTVVDVSIPETSLDDQTTQLAVDESEVNQAIQSIVDVPRTSPAEARMELGEVGKVKKEPLQEASDANLRISEPVQDNRANQAKSSAMQPQNRKRAAEAGSSENHPRIRKQKAGNQDSTNSNEDIICSDCKANFKSNSAGFTHHLKHSTCKHFVCVFENCNKRFRVAKSLKTHQKIHSGENYPCPLCKATFRCEAYLASHTKRVHEKDITPRVSKFRKSKAFNSPLDIVEVQMSSV